MSLTVGSRLGPYEIVARLGAGGMGEVYRALDPRLGREVALKVLPDAFARDRERLARFEREACTVSALSHPSIVTLFSIEEDAGLRFLTMELVEGQTLDRLVAPGGLPLARVLDLAIPLAEALVAAHTRGVVQGAGTLASPSPRRTVRRRVAPRRRPRTRRSPGLSPRWSTPGRNHRECAYSRVLSMLSDARKRSARTPASATVAESGCGHPPSAMPAGVNRCPKPLYTCVSHALPAARMRSQKRFAPASGVTVSTSPGERKLGRPG